MATAFGLALICMAGCDKSRLRTAVGATNQAKLEAISVMAEDKEDRRAAVKKLTDQTELAKTAVEAQDPIVRHIAVKKLTAAKNELTATPG